MSNGMDRRDFLKQTGLTLALVTTPSGLQVLAQGGRSDTGSVVFSPGPWLRITPDNRVTVLLCKSEMGQGIHTAIPMIVADELEADWDQIRTEMAPVTEEYQDPIMKSHSTYGSTTIRHLYQPLRKLGAAGREMLLEAAAGKWKVSIADCQADQGQVQHRPSGRSFSFGELVQEASRLPVPESPRLKEKSEYKLMGTPVARLDIPAKVSGEARYGIDAFVPGMLYAALARPPAFGARVISHDEQAARRVEGVRHVVKISRGVGVCADTLEGAWKGRMALQAKWDDGVQPTLSTAGVDQLLAASLEKQGVSARQDAGVKDALAKADKRVQAEYFLPYLSHAVMETMDCTAHVQRDRCDVWSATQSQSGVQGRAVKITGLAPEQIHVHTAYLGGGYGRRGGTFVVDEALELSEATGRPVKVLWTREEDMQYGAYRPGHAHQIEASLDDRGHVTAWSHKVAAPSVLAGLRGGARGGPPVDPFAARALAGEFPYQIPNMSVEYVRVDTPIPVRTWRSPSGSHQGWAVESFMDELAHAAGQDPVQFRLRHLEHDARAHRVLKLAAEKAAWGRPLARGEARGIATFPSDESYVAEVAEISVNRKSGVIQVHRVVCAVDCGPVVNSDTVAAQMEGALTMGLSAALKEKLEFSRGGVQSENFSDYPILRMSEAPDVEVHIVESDGKVGGAGEPSLPPIAPAVANAFFAATGVRIRRLPMTPEAVLQALGRG